MVWEFRSIRRMSTAEHWWWKERFCWENVLSRKTRTTENAEPYVKTIIIVCHSLKICVWMVESNLQLFFVCVDRLSNFSKSLSGNSDSYMCIWVIKQHKLDMLNWPSIISTPFIEVLGYFDIRLQSMMDWVKTRQKSFWKHWRHITVPWDWLTMLSRPTATSL